MPTIGPTLPPHLASKRKRSDGKEADTTNSARSPSAEKEDKRQRLLGPTLPPAPLDKLPREPLVPNDQAESDSDDDFGPAPPNAGVSASIPESTGKDNEMDAIQAEDAIKPQREEWMLAPPSSVDWVSRIDTTKLKSRRFNTGKGARAPTGGGAVDTSLWTETPDEKRKRLQDEVMGISKPTQHTPTQRKVEERGEGGGKSGD